MALQYANAFKVKKTIAAKSNVTERSFLPGLLLHHHKTRTQPNKPPRQVMNFVLEVDYYLSLRGLSSM